MVSVSHKPPTYRTATARAVVVLGPKVFELVKKNQLGKGNLLSVCQIAGIQAAKNTAQTIPLCHPISLTDIQVELELNEQDYSVGIVATAECVDRTGVEMEAMCAVSGAALTVYDMCKGVDKGIQITIIQLVKKTGGKSGDWTSN
jgi:molybdenum cofactor biosynthesis protein MoaC